MKLKITAISVCIILFSGCIFYKEVRISGKALGTTYHIKIIDGYLTNKNDISFAIEKRLVEIEKSMSLYDKDSEISRFNSFEKANVNFRIFEDFAKTIKYAIEIYNLTKGAWDGSVKPLVDLWGLGSVSREYAVPDSVEIKKVLSKIGFDKIILADDMHISKKDADITIDLSSIAKGYAVDAISVLLEKRGFDDFLVEIGGEVYAKGYTKKGKKWKVGINLPEKNAAYNEVIRTVSLKDKAIAVSGDYRKFFEKNGKRYSHIIDPRTGMPVSGRIVSAAVLAKSCTFADGMATAMMVMDIKQGLALISTLENVECHLIVKAENGGLTEYYSSGFEKYITDR